ncbi:uncharacterized protein tasor2 isoform X3 [Clupea harengus]|uniref:Uncharacterized protein tasor2 isoform X3 n=1 Tax=Clupea harengus TaxID=7950 RepID=A0A6P8EUU2_CLUHA|nr:uncharacterized protein tasor2 isoform X3 [Clupea harengus]
MFFKRRENRLTRNSASLASLIMENDIRPREGLLEPVLPGSAIFDDSILPPLYNSYLYEESRKSFIYSSAHLINNDILQKRYAAFRVEKRERGYTEEELEESFGFLLFEDESKANKLGDSGLLTGHSTISTLGDPSKGVCVSKYSDCLDVKRWYCGKSGYIAIVRLTKGRVKEESENYTVNFTVPTEGFDCHESDQLRTVTATTSSFLAFERTQHYMYELLNGGKDTEKCPRQVCPFAIVAFSYEKAEPAVPESSEKSQEKTVFCYQPWTGQLVIDSFVYEIGLKSSSGALLPAQLPKTLRIKSVIRVSDLTMLLPKEIFETCFSGEVMVGGKCCSLYEVVSTEADDNLLSLLTGKLKEKDIALVFTLCDSGFFVLLHSSYFLSYEDANSEKTEALQGLFIFPESRTIQRDTKSCRKKSPVSSEILQVLPALNYAETEVEKSGPGQHEKIRILMEKHLEHYGTLIHPGLQSSPPREASMFPDQYDVPYVFKHLFPTPKWTEVIQLQMRSYLDQPRSFEFPVKRATELLWVGREQRRDDPDDEVYYCISSPEEASRTPTREWLEKPLEADVSCPTDTFRGINSAAEELSDRYEPPESPPESMQHDLSDLSKGNTEIMSKESSPAAKTSPTTLGVELTVAAVSTEISPPAAAVVTQEVLTESFSSLTSTDFPKECVFANSCDDQTLKISSSAQEVMTNESTLHISSKTSVPMEVSDAKCAETEANVAPCPEMENKAPTKPDWRTLPRRRGRKRKRILKPPVSKISLKQSSSLSPNVAAEVTDDRCVGAEQNQPNTEKVQSSLQKRNSEDFNKTFVDQAELQPNNSASSECLENSYSQSQEREENQSSDSETPSKTMCRSFPRRCRIEQNSQTDVPKRGKKEILGECSIETTRSHPPKRKMDRPSLRCDLKTIITDCGRIFVPHGTEVFDKDLELALKGQKTADDESGLKKTEVEESKSLSISSDRADSVGISETVNDELVPKVMDDKEDSLALTKDIGATTEHAKESQVQNPDRPSSLCQSEQKSPTVHEQHNTGNESSSESKLVIDEAKEPCSTDSSQKKKKRSAEYTIISISQLRTVLRRGKKDAASAAEKTKEVETSESEPNLKRLKDDVHSNDDRKNNSDSVCEGNSDQASPATPTTEDSEGLRQSQKHQSLLDSAQEPSDKKTLEPGMKLGKDLNELTQFKDVPSPKKASTIRNKRANPPRKLRKRKAVFKENECLSFDTAAAHNTDQLNQAQCQTANDLTGHVLEEPCVGSDEKSCGLEGVVNAACLPADALTLLADIALSGNSGKNERMLQNLQVGLESKLSQRQGRQDSVKESGSQEAVSVLHALLGHPADRFTIPSKSLLSKALLMKGQCVVVISKDHSYSQPPSLMLGLSGAPLKAFSRSTDSLTLPNSLRLQGRPLSSKDDRILLQVHREASSDSWDKTRVNINGWEPPMKQLMSSISKDVPRSKRHRQIVEKEGSIKVTRPWQEQYDFSLDSKFTNDPHDKTVTRALHGPWDFNIGDSPQEVHLIFHMWIGLFYSRSASRFFHIDPKCLMQDGGFTKLPDEVELHSTSEFSKSKGIKVSSQFNTSLTTVPSPLPSEPGGLNQRDETTKASASSSEVLDLSLKGCRPLDLTSANTKTRESSSERHDSQSLENLGWPTNTNTNSPLSERKSELVSTNNDSQFRVYDVVGSSYHVNDVTNWPPKSRDYVHVQQAANTWSETQKSSDILLPGTKELAQQGSSATVVQLNSTDQIGHKEDSISSVAKCTSPNHTEDVFARGESTTVPPDNGSNVFINHDSVVKPLGHVSVKSNTVSSVEATASVPTDNDSSAETAVAVNDQNDSKMETVMTVQDQNDSKMETVMTVQDQNDSKMETVMTVQDQNDSKMETVMTVQDQNDSKMETVMTVQDQNDLGAETAVAVHEQNNSEVETVMTVQDANNSKDDTIMIEQYLHDPKAETTMQDTHGLKASVILDVHGPIDSRVEMVQEQTDPSTESTMTVHDPSDLNSHTVMMVDDPSDSKVETVKIPHDQKDSQAETTMTEPKQDDSETDPVIIVWNQNQTKPETAVAVRVPYDAEVQPVITAQNQNEAKPETAATVKTPNEVQPCLAVQNQTEIQPETAVAPQAPQDSEVQPAVTEQNHDTNPETAVETHNDSEIKANLKMNDQTGSKPRTPVVEGEESNTDGETQALVQINLNTETTSEENNRYSEDKTVMDLNEKHVQVHKVLAYSVNEYEHKVPMEVQRDCNLECEKSTAGNERRADTVTETREEIDTVMKAMEEIDTVMEAMEEIDHQSAEHEILLEGAVVKAWEDESDHEGNVDEDLTLTRERNEQMKQSRSIVAGETKDESSAGGTETPNDVEEQQKTSKMAVLTSSQVAHDPCHITKVHELKGIEDKRSLTPTVDEIPDNASVCVDERSHTMGTGSALSRSSTPTQDELPSDCGSAACEPSFHEARSDPYDKALYDTEGLDLAALGHMISWFRKERNNKREFNSRPRQNSGPSQLSTRLATSVDSSSSQSSGKIHWKYPNSVSQFSSNKGLKGSFLDYMESNVQSTESYKMQCEDVSMTDQEFKSEDVTSPFHRHSSMDPYARDSESILKVLSKRTPHDRFHSISEASTRRDRKEKQVQTNREEEILDTESDSITRMEDKLQEWGCWKDLYSTKQKHSSGSHCQQRRNPGHIDTSGKTWHWEEEEEELHDALYFGVNSTFLRTGQMEESSQSSSTSSSESEQESLCNKPFKNYRKGEGLKVTVDFKRGDCSLSGHESPICAVLDDEDRQKTYKNYPITKPRTTMHSRTIKNTCHKGTQRYVEKFLQKWDDLHQTKDDVTQSSMDFEYLIFSEKMNDILKCSKSEREEGLSMPCKSPVTIQFSCLNEQDASEEMCDALPVFSESKIKVTLHDRKEEREEGSGHMPYRLQRLSCKRESVAACSKISAIAAECAKSYYAMMKDVCTNRSTTRQTDRIRKQQDSPKLRTSKPVELCGKMKEDLFERLHDSLNSVVREACKTKYRFFILVTSEDPFFRETKDLLENEGHISVEPDQFDLENSRPSSPLLIILRNEDISKHICQVPHLLELKKSSSVLFAGIDQPDDVVNLTHQELFGKGGFVVFEGTALNKLSLENMKKIVVFLEELSKKGKWKWFLHYRDSRRFRENAWSHQDVHDKKHFLDCCQEAGMVEVLPYHECDVISRDHPNYLHCLIRLQVQNAATRFPVFVTDTPDKSFGKNGILTMNMNTFSQILSNDSCTIS